MTTDNDLRIRFDRDGFIHPDYVTLYQNVSMNQWVKEYTLDILKAHWIAILFPSVCYKTVMAIVKGTKVLESVDTDEFYGVVISDAE